MSDVDKTKLGKMKKMHLLLGFVIVLYPLVPLLVYRYFYTDFANNLWVIQYYARYFKLYHAFPTIINSADGLVGMTNPLYYGYFYYQVLGLLAVIIGGARRALLLCIVILVTMVYIIYTKIFMRLFNRFDENCFTLAHGITALMMWSTYAITKIYDDGARGEYFAILFLYIAIGCWILALFQSSLKWKIALWSLMALNIMFICGTHPITTEIGGVIIAVMIIVTLPKVLKSENKKLLVVLFGLALIILIALAVSPWLYTLQNAGSTRISSTVLGADDKSGPSNFIIRLMLVPFDIESLYKGMNVTSPYFDLQINMPLCLLFLLTIILVFKNNKIGKKSKIKSVIIFSIALLMLLFSASYKLLPITSKIFYSIQFTFRLITYVDLFILLGLVYNLTILGISQDKQIKKKLMCFLVICLTLSAHNVFIQLTQAYAIKDYDIEDISSDRVPKDFYWGNDYSDITVPIMKKGETSKIEEVNLPMNKEKMTTNDVKITIYESTIINTNLSVSKYNAIYLNGKKIESNDLYRLSSEEYTYAFLIDNPGDYVIHYEFEIPQEYDFLRIISYISVFLLLCINLSSWIFAFASDKRRLSSHEEIIS